MRKRNIWCFLLSVVLTSNKILCQQSSSPYSTEDIPFYDTFTNILNELKAAEYESNVKLRQAYDYVIIGAGPSGCVLANRLSENPNHTVLLIEAGIPEIPWVTGTPMAAPNLQLSKYNWGYATEPQERACLSMRDKRCNWPRGRGLGGSSIINYMIYTRGNRRDFDRWAEAGNIGWSYKDVLPYFQKFEKSMLKTQFVDDTFGKTGLLQIEDPPFKSSVADAFVQSAIQANYSLINYNGFEQIGVSYLQATSRNGWRQTAARAFLSHIKQRSNLHISTKSWAAALIFDDEQENVKGVKFFRNKKEVVAKARNEVILSAGAFESAKLLMLSGIGPKKDLEKLNIEVIKDLPVGETLYEHMAVLGPVFLLNNNLTDGLINSQNVARLDPLLDFFNGRGPLTTTGIETLLYMKANNSISSDPGYPDIELLQSMVTVAFDTTEVTRHGLKMSDKAFDAVFAPIQNQRAFQILPMLLHPRSKGYLKLKSQNPFHHPLFYPNFFEDNRDIETLLEGIREAIRIVSQSPLQQLGASLYNVTVPGCEDTPFNSDSYWRCYIQHLSATLHHQVGTCKMGPITDKSSVVDPRARVHGIQNLRIADTSIIPQSPSGHTAAFSFMIGEKVADLIKDNWTDDYPKIDIRSLNRNKRFDWQQGDAHRRKKLLHLKTRPEEYTTEHPFDATLKIEEEFEEAAIGDAGLILWGHTTEHYNDGLKFNYNNDKNQTDLKTAGSNIVVQNQSNENTQTKAPAENNSWTVNATATINAENTTTLSTYKKKQDLIGNSNENGTESGSGMDKLMATMPAIDEDMIRTYTLNATDRYGRGRAKAKYITKELSHMNFSKYTENDEKLSDSLMDAEVSKDEVTRPVVPVVYPTEIIKMHVEKSFSVQTSSSKNKSENVPEETN